MLGGKKLRYSRTMCDIKLWANVEPFRWYYHKYIKLNKTFILHRSCFREFHVLLIRLMLPFTELQSVSHLYSYPNQS